MDEVVRSSYGDGGGEDNKTQLIMSRPTDDGGPGASSGKSGEDHSGYVDLLGVRSTIELEDVL